MKIYALVGKSGTGKSYKALNIAYENNIDLVIDDGLLINGNKLLGGKSAKRERTIIGAVKRAIFHHNDHRQEIIEQINLKKYDSLLVLGTSVRMVEKITRNLKLGKIDEFIYIEDISTKEELKLADINRNKKGKHIIPLPSLELKRDFSGYLLDKVKHILKREDEHIIGEKTVTRPTFSFYGNFSISDNTLRQIISISIKKNNGIKLVKSKIKKEGNDIKITVFVDIKYGIDIQKEVLEFQRKIVDDVYKMTLINIISCDVIIKNLKIKF